MKYFQLYTSVSREVANNKVTTADITYWFNRAIQEFVDNRYKGVDELGVSFEQDQDVSQDLKLLYKTFSTTTLTTSTDFANGYEYVLPIDIRYITNEQCNIQFTSNSATVTVTTKVTPVTQDNINVKLEDPFSPHRLYLLEAKPLRLFKASGTTTPSSVVVLVTDGNYIISKYNGRYLREPRYLVIQDAANTTDSYPDFAEKALKEIITICVRMILENTTSERYKTYNIEEEKAKL